MRSALVYLPSAVGSVVLIKTVTCDCFLSAKKASFSTMALVRSGFEKANSGNLPSVDIFMITAFLNESECFNAAEIRGYKAHRSGRESYGDSAVGYVQLRRERNTCVLKARVCPEHRIHSKAYEVKAVIDETEEEIKEINCEGCAASLGGCKHALAFLMWLHRRSKEPAPTEIECYWVKSKFSGVGRSLKCVAAKNMGEKKKADSGSSTANSRDFLNAIIEHGERNKLNTQLSRHSFEEENNCLKRLSLHRLCQDFLTSDTSVSNILSFFRNVCNPEMCSEIEVNTRGQSENHLWHEMRYGRITASIFHAAANCKTKDGSLVQQILGGPKMHSSLAMKRGQKLESKVIYRIKEEIQEDIKISGQLIYSEKPVFGASLDGIGSDFVVEIKCPTTENNKTAYVKNGLIQPKVLAQIHLQMEVFNFQKGLLCVADPNFEHNMKIEIQWIENDASFFQDLKIKALRFWEDAILPKLLTTLSD